jgi:hypothetical protein
VEQERRDSSRIRVGQAGVRVLEPAAWAGAQVLELSASGVGLALPAGSWPTFARGRLRLGLPGAGEVELEAEPIRAAPVPGGLLVGLRFCRAGPEALGRLSVFLVEHFRREGQARDLGAAARVSSLGVSRRDLVFRMLSHHLIGQARPLRAMRGPVELPGSIAPRSFETVFGRLVVEGRAQGGLAQALREGEELTFFFPSYQALAFFDATVLRLAGERVWLTLPANVRQTGFRGSLRVALPGALRLVAAIVHPRLAGTSLWKDVLEVSARGLAFALEPTGDRLFPGEVLPELRLELPGGPVRARAALRSVRLADSGVGLVCGLELLGFGGEADEERWGRFVFEAGHPHVLLGQESMVATTWDVLVRARYPEEVAETLRPGLEASFDGAWRQHAGEPRLGRFLLVQKEDRSVGTVAASLLYPRTWMVHHLGIDEAERRADRQGLFRLARDAYCGMGHLLHNLAAIDHWVIYAEAGRPWNDMLYGQFVLRHPQREDVVYDGYGVYRRLPGPPVEVPPERLGGVRAVPASAAHVDLLVRHLALNAPAIEFAAYGYGDDLELADFGRRCQALGYRRSRRVFCALEDEGRPLAALLAETGEPGVNVFGLLDRCWLVYLEPEAARDDRVKLALLDEAVRYYASQGRTSFLYFGHWGGEPMDLLEPLGYNFEAEGMRFLARREVLPAYMAYTDELMRMLRG